MKIFLRLLSLLTLSALATAPLARADETPATPGTPAPAGEHARAERGKRREHRLAQLDEKLHLTDAQKTQIQGIWSTAEQQGKALRDEAAGASDDRRAKMRETMKATRDQVRAVLTPDQQKIFDAMPPEGRGHKGPRPGGDDKPAEPAPGK